MDKNKKFSDEIIDRIIRRVITLESENVNDENYSDFNIKAKIIEIIKEEFEDVAD